MPIVVDASSVVELLLRTSRARRIQQAVQDQAMVAPDLVNVEVVSVLRRLERIAALTPDRAAEAVRDLRTAPIRRLPTLSLISATWGLRHSVTSYDACYVSLANALACPLVTADERLARAAGTRVSVVVA